jgi:hypothetical protein
LAPNCSEHPSRLDREGQEQPAFRHYEHVRDLVLRMMDEARGYQTSAYWQQEIEGFDRAGVIDQLRASGRHHVIEIGAGWGGFAHHLKTLFPNISYTIVALPQTLLFSATYLKTTFPGWRRDTGSSVSRCLTCRIRCWCRSRASQSTLPPPITGI